MVQVDMSTDAWVKKQCPIIMVYAPSTTGKTTLAATLFDDDAYWPVLYIDADEGTSTIAKFTNNKKLCDYRSKSERPAGDTVFKWFGSTLKEARTSHHKAIIVEGLTRFRDNEASDWLIDHPDDAEGMSLQRAYIKPSVLSGALYGAMSKIQDVRKRAGTGVPIFGSLNAKLYKRMVKGAPPIEYYIPNLSDNLIENLMGRSDIFAELKRNAGMPTQLMTTFSKHNKFRKARNPAVAKMINDMRDPNLPDLLDKWARVEQEQTEATAKWAADDDDPQTDNSDNEKTDDTT